MLLPDKKKPNKTTIYRFILPKKVVAFEKISHYDISVNPQCYLKSPNLRFAWHFRNIFILALFCTDLLHCVLKLHCLKGI